MNIYEVGQAYRKALLAGSADAAADLVAVYSGALEAIQAEAAALVAELDKRGDVPGAAVRAYRIEQAGLARFTQSATEELRRVNAIAAGAIEGYQRTAAALAIEAFTAAMETRQAVAVGIGPTFNLVASNAVEAVAGYLSDGSPLASVLDAYAGEAAAQAAQELKIGLAAGLPTRQIAERVADASGMALNKALTIARTETLRAYREVAFDSYDANADLVDSWMWVCGMQPNSCAACVAMHGTIHPLSERMHGHPNCGCSSVPILSDIQAEEQRPPQEPEDWLAEQDEDTLAQVFGSRKQAARYKAGEFALSDVVLVTDSRQWGRTVWRQIPGAQPTARQTRRRAA